MADQEQGNVRQEFNLGRIGLNMDSSVNQVEKGKLTYALNAALENFDANSVNYQNEPGNELCLNFPANFHLIGEHFINEQNKHVFFLTNPETGESQIGYMDNNNCIYVQYIQGDCLNFNINYPIHKAVHKITNCTTEIYWTDGLNPRRYLDLNDPPWVTIVGENICDVIVEVGVIDCNKLKVQPNFNIPELEVVDVVTGGELTAGVYQFAIQYCNASGDGYTSYYSVTNPTPIANTQLTTNDFNYAVSRSIRIDINNLDVTGYFQYYNLAVIKTINAITSVQLVGTFFIDDSARQITYSGQNKTEIPLTINDILEKFPYYEIAQDLTAVRDILVWDNITSIDRINFQSIASKINLLWQTYKIPADENYSDSLNATNLRSYLRDEVYPFEIVFLLDNGKQTDGFHIPGRAKNYNELSQPDVPSTNNDFIGDGTTAPYWKIYNTASVLGNSPIDANYNIGNATPYQYGEFAYWESLETYPCNTQVWGDLAGQPIRHHKFPDVLVSPIFESATPTIVSDKYLVQMQTSDAVYPIGVKINVQQVSQLISQSNLPQTVKDSIVGFKIVRGDRSTNRSIIAKGILRNVGKYVREDTNYYYPNYPYNDLNKDPFLLEQNNAYNSECNTFAITVTLAGTVQYQSCNTGQMVTIPMTIGMPAICSISYPVILSGTATITQVTAITYTLTAYVQSPDNSTTFQYTDGVTLSTININVYVGYPISVSSTTLPTRLSGSSRYSITQTDNKNIACYPAQLDGFNNQFSSYRHVFNSPETSFGQPVLGNILKLENVLYGAGKAHFVQVKKNATYKLISRQAQVDALLSSYRIAIITGTLDATAMFTAFQAYLQIYINGINRQNFGYSFNSVANYDYSSIIQNNVNNYLTGGLGIKQRELDICQYLIPGVQSVGDNFNINNWQRESSVYIKTTESRNNLPVTPLPYPNVTNSLIINGTSAIDDTSRYTVSERGHCDTPEYQEPIDVVSYYGSIKVLYPNQWGQIYSYTSIDTGFQRIFDLLPTYDTETIFGGDTFISRFAFKTKLPFFIDNRVGAPDDSDVFFDEIGNIAYPQYWYSSRSILYDWKTPNNVTLKNIISIKAHNLDCPNDSTILVGTTTTTSTTTTSVNGVVTAAPLNSSYTGKMYLFAYGIPNFYVESSINVDLRQAFNNLEGDFYPHVSSGIPDTWLQQSVVPIVFDNTYTYNVTYSKKNKENFFSHLPVDWDNDQCYTNFPFRAIYSDDQQSFVDNRINSWLIYRPVSFFDFPQNYGDLISLDGIQNKAILARFENKSLLYNTMLTIDTSNPQAAYLGNDKLFNSAPAIDFAETDLGYVGCQNKMLLKIPQGQITIDAKRGQIFLISGNQAQDLSAFGSGLNRFFTDHLAFEILRYFPTADTDNHFNGLGLHGVYDSKFDRIIISKLDYVPLSDDVLYDGTTQEFYVNKIYGDLVLRKVVQLTDREYFCNKSWTLSFNFNSKSWVSFHSYIPNFYIAENNFFYSGLNEGCNLEALAINEIPTPSTTTTTTTVLYCSLAGEATYVPPPTTTTTTTPIPPPTTTTTTTPPPTTTTTTTLTYCQSIGAGNGCFNWDFTAGATGAIVQWTDCSGNNQTSVLNEGESGSGCLCDGATPNVLEGSLAIISQVGQCGDPTPTTTTTTTSPEWTTIDYGFNAVDPNQACDNWELNVHTTVYVLVLEVPIGLGDHLYTTANVANPAPAGFYARPCSLGICTYEVTGFYGEITGIAECGTLTTTTTTTLPPAPTYVAIDASAIGYNQTDAANTGICCIQKLIYVDSFGAFIFSELPIFPVPSGYTLVTQFWVDDNGVPYFDNASVMYVDQFLTIPAPAGYYGGAANGYRRIQGSVGLFSTPVTSCAGVPCL